MKENITKFLKFFILSASNDNRGASGKKVIGYVLAFCVLIIHLSWLKNAHEHNDYSQMMSVLWFDGIMIGSIYGLNITDKKLNASEEKKEDEKPAQ